VPEATSCFSHPRLLASHKECAMMDIMTRQEETLGIMLVVPIVQVVCSILISTVTVLASRDQLNVMPMVT